MAWPSPSSNRRIESGGERRPWVIGGVVTGCIILLIVLLTSGGEHPCITVQELCEEEISEGIKSKRDTVCMGIYMKLHTVWDLENERSSDTCESWIDAIESTSDDDVPGIDEWQSSLTSVRKEMGVPGKPENANVLLIGPTTGEWFNDDRGGRRLVLEGTLRVDPAAGSLRNVSVKAILTIHFAGRNPRTKTVVLANRTEMLPESQIQIRTESAAIVGADERRLVKKIAVTLEAKGTDAEGRQVRTKLIEPNMETQEETRNFPIGGQRSSVIR